MILQPQTTETIISLKSFNFKDLERTEELGRDYNFKEASQILEDIYKDLVVVSNQADSLKVALEVGQQIDSLAQRFKNQIDSIKKFVLKDNPNASNQYNTINQEVKNLQQDGYRQLQPLIERLSVLNLKPKEIDAQFSKLAESIKEVDKIKEDLQKKRDNIEVSLKEVRESLGEKGTIISRNDFQGQASEHNVLAGSWFIASISSILVTILLVIVLLSGVLGWLFPSLKLIPGNENILHNIQIILFKVVMLSIAYVVMYQSIKNYKVNKHLYVVNKHRQLALHVYPYMANATSNQEQSNSIVVQAAKAIFDQGTTGYLDGNENQTPVNLTEVITRATGDN